MKNDIFNEIHKGLHNEGVGRDRYTKKAFHMIPPIKEPEILDIGCGPGLQTILLAKLSYGNVIGLDINQPHLDELDFRAKEANLSNRIKTINCSMHDMKYPPETFDIIWSEGSIFFIGFENGLRKWRRLIKPNGFLVVHDMVWISNNPPGEIKGYWEKLYPKIKTIQSCLDLIPRCKYKIFGHFPLPIDAWWKSYYKPLENRVNNLMKKYKHDPNSLAEINKVKREIELYKKYKKWFGSAFFIMQKK
jgi:ubiquinone/menaquinone biosynthesis C-methylase UbiE